MVVYADVVWLLNLCIDYLLLLLTAIILKKKIRKWRLLCGAFIGSILVIITLISVDFAHPIVKLLFSFLIVYAAFGFTRIRTFIATVCMFYFVTFMVGGGLIGLHFFLMDSPILRGMALTQPSSFGDPISWLFVIIGFPIIYYFSKKRIGDIEITRIRYEQIVEVELIVNGLELKLNGLIDNGNQLYDPITKTPVMIVEADTIKQLIPQWLLEQSKQPTRLLHEKEEQIDWMKRIRIIPYRGIGQSHQFLLAVKPDTIRVYKDGEILSVRNVYVGINHTKLSSDNEYTCILHPKMLLSTTA
ncbi:sigma-E processing peptidase SpoIIGA [Ectobacillus polymachus]|uniref:sigma-E processing peptidase SpoIIGA n=1 Tax=Ectobacillus polymachus TaxID=1508806 RepID=UPI003A8C7C35